MKAKERQATSTGGTDPQLRPNLDKAENKRTDEIVAKKLGIGGKDTYRKEKFIVDNKDSLTPEDFSDWDEGKLSTNKAFKKIKKEKELLEEQIKKLEFSNQNMQNYEKLIEMIPELEDLIDEDQKLKVLLAANFQRPKNSESKQRKVAVEYVRLCGYSANGDRATECQNGTRLTLNEIASQLGTSKRELKRALRIERNLTDSMKELLDTGEITKTFASDTIATLIKCSYKRRI